MREQVLEFVFFTMDVARRVDGEWLIVELGDGEVAGLPDGADPAAFYRALQGRWSAATLHPLT